MRPSAINPAALAFGEHQPFVVPRPFSRTALGWHECFCRRVAQYWAWDHLICWEGGLKRVCPRCGKVGTRFVGRSVWCLLSCTEC